MNLPNARKLKKGCTPVLSEVQWFEPEHVYDLSEFTPAPGVQVEGVTTNVAVDFGDIKRLNSVDELDKWNVPDRVKVIIVQGHDPDDSHDPSHALRSQRHWSQARPRHSKTPPSYRMKQACQICQQPPLTCTRQPPNNSPTETKEA